MGTPYKKLDKDDAVLLLIDHQAGLISLVQDFSPDDFKNSVIALADIGKFFELPTIITTSFDTGPNGPIVPEVVERHPDAPFIHRPGQINAWDNEEFVAAIKATGRKQLIMAGVVTDVAYLPLPVRDRGRLRRVRGHRRFRHLQPHGAAERLVAHDRRRCSAHGGAVACELQRDWRNDMEGLAGLLSNHLPNYRNLMTSYFALEEAKKGRG